MPDKFLTWPNTQADIVAAGASLFLVKVTGDSAYYCLGAIRDLDMVIDAIGKPDSLLRQKSWGFKPNIVVPCLQASSVELKILDQLLIKTPVSWALTEIDGKVWQDDGTKIGLRWEIECGGRFDDFRMIRYILGGNLDKTELDGIVGSTPVTLGTPASSDVLFTLAQTEVPANMVPNGASKFEFKASTDAAYVDFGEFEEMTYKFSCIGPMSKGGRQMPRTSAIKFECTVKGLQTKLTEVELLDDMVGSDLDCKITHMDGVVLEIPNTNFNATPSYKNQGNADKWRNIDLTIGGVLNTDATGLIWQTTGGTTWDDLWTPPV